MSLKPVPREVDMSFSDVRLKIKTLQNTLDEETAARVRFTRPATVLDILNTPNTVNLLHHPCGSASCCVGVPIQRQQDGPNFEVAETQRRMSAEIRPLIPRNVCVICRVVEQRNSRRPDLPKVPPVQSDPMRNRRLLLRMNNQLCLVGSGDATSPRRRW